MSGNASVAANEKLSKKSYLWSKKARRFWNYKALLIMMIPTSIFIFINGYMPIFGLVIAFKNINYVDGIFGSPWCGIDNFKYLFSTDIAWRITRNTVCYNICFIIADNVLAITLAILFNEIRNKKASKVYQTMMILPYFLSMVVISYVVYAFLNYEYGFVNNTIFPLFGKDAIQWYNEPKFWPFLIFGIHVWAVMGYNSIVYLASLTGIDGELYEAAYIDGASKWQQIKSITLPLLKPVVVILLILALGGIIRGDFGLFYQVPMNSEALYSVTDVLDTYVYRALTTLSDVGMSSAAGFYQSIIGAILVISANLVVRKLDPEQALF